MNRLLCGVIILSLLAAVPVGLRRISAEKQSRQVELAADYVDFIRLAQLDGLDAPAALASLRETGITSVGLEEITLERLHRLGAVTLRHDFELIDQARTSPETDPELRRWAEGRAARGMVYALTSEPETAGWLRRALADRLGEERIDAWSLGGLYLVGAPMDEGGIEKLPLGFWEPEYRAILASGLRIVLRPANYPGLGGEAMERALAAVSEAGGRPSTVIFAGNQVPGYPDNLKDIAQVMDRHGLVQGMIEAPVQLGFVKQAGQEALAEAGGFRAARVYSITKREMDAYTGREVLDRWVRAVKERNIRILYIRPLKKLPDPAETRPFEANLVFLQQAVHELGSDGWNSGPAAPFGPSGPTAWESWLISAGVMADGLILWRRLFPLPDGADWAVLAVGVLAAAVVFFAGRGELARKALALAAALVFPALGLMWAGWRASRIDNRSLPSILARASEVLLGAVGLSMIGAVFVATLLSHQRYLLEIDFFRGVKLTLTVPLLLAAWGLVRGWGFGAEGEFGSERFSLRSQMLRVWGYPLTVGQAVGLGALGVVIYVYLGRSGHTAGIEVSAAEIQVRDFLERLMVARPRTKEFLIGFPSLMLAVWALARDYRRWAIPLLLAGGVGLTSLINSFEHLRTELLISVWRTANGVILGLILGMIAAALAEAGHRYYLGQETKAQESAWR